MRRESSASTEAGSLAGASAGCSRHDLPPAAAEPALSEDVIDWKAELRRDEAQHMLYALASVPVAGAAWMLQTALLPAYWLGRIWPG